MDLTNKMLEPNPEMNETAEPKYQIIEYYEDIGVCKPQGMATYHDKPGNFYMLFVLCMVLSRKLKLLPLDQVSCPYCCGNLAYVAIHYISRICTMHLRFVKQTGNNVYMWPLI